MFAFISEAGRKLKNNRPLASATVAAIIEHGEDIFIKGKTITVRHKGDSVQISSATYNG